MPDRVTGLTLLNKQILIKITPLQNILMPKNVKICYIIITLLHELAHFYIR